MIQTDVKESNNPKRKSDSQPTAMHSAKGGARIAWKKSSRYAVSYYLACVNFVITSYHVKNGIDFDL